MVTQGELNDRLTRLEEQFAAYKALMEERHNSLRRNLIAITVVLSGVVAWAAAQGFDLTGLVNAVG